MSQILKDLKTIKVAIDRNGGRPILETKTPNKASLILRGYLKTGQANEGRVVWLTDKALIELEDAK